MPDTQDSADKEETGGLLAFMDEVMSGDVNDLFYSYEPWDPKELDTEIPTIGFQEAFHFCDAPFRYLSAGNRIGKTLCAAVEASIMMTGEVPYSMRYDKGFVTDIPRPWKGAEGSVGFLNKARWGILDPDTGVWTPPLADQAQPSPGKQARPLSAPCGFITGVGVFPVNKISRRNRDAVWICTWKSVRDERWIKLVSELIPEQYLDKRWREDGYSEKAHRFRLSNGNEIVFITYEMGPERAQGANVWALFLDEEPKSRDFFTECDQRLMEAAFEGWMSLLYTPLQGMSWAYLDIYVPLVKGDTPHVKMFHATQYDSPYLQREAVDRRRARCKPWEIKARVFGKPGIVRGQPYFDYEKLVGDDKSGHVGWLSKFVPRGREVTIQRDANGTIELVDMDPETEGDGWILLEDDRKRGDVYFITADTGEGDSDPANVVDRNVAYLWKVNTEGKTEWPIPVGQFATTVETLVFAESLRDAAEYFWQAVIVPEVTGKTGGTLMGALHDYPYAFHCRVLNDKTRKLRTKWGFEMTPKTRPLVWSLVSKYIDDHEAPVALCFWDLLKECAEAIYGKNGRPDHPPHGTSDCITAWGIGLYAHQYGWEQLNVDRSATVPTRKSRETSFIDNLRERYGKDPKNDPKKRPLGQARKSKSPSKDWFGTMLT